MFIIERSEIRKKQRNMTLKVSILSVEWCFFPQCRKCLYLNISPQFEYALPGFENQNISHILPFNTALFEKSCILTHLNCCYSLLYSSYSYYWTFQLLIFSPARSVTGVSRSYVENEADYTSYRVSIFHKFGHNIKFGEILAAEENSETRDKHELFNAKRWPEKM